MSEEKPNYNAEQARRRQEIAQRRRKAEQYYLRGLTQEEIAEILKVDQSTISRDLAAVRELWLAAAVEDHDKKVAETRGKVMAVALEAWQQWVKSQSAEKRRQRRRLVDGEWVTVEEMVESPQPAYKYLDVIGDCIDRLAKLDGLYKPLKFAPTDPTGEKEYGGGLTDEQRIANLTRLLDAARERASGQDSGE